MITVAQLCFNCKLCGNRTRWEVIELCSTCSPVPQHDPCLTYCYSKAKNQHDAKHHCAIDIK